MEIVPGVYAIIAGKGHFMGLFPPNAYLVIGQRSALVDAGEAEGPYPQGILKVLEELRAPPLEYILITHGHQDHQGGADKLRQATGAQVVIHPLEAKELKADGKAEDGSLWNLGGLSLEAIHTPGHTTGSLCFLLREKQVLFTGDNVLGVGYTVIRPKEGDMSQYLASMQKLLTRDIQLICPGHGSVIRSPQAKLRELIQHRQEREAQVLDCLVRGLDTVDGLLKDIYPELDSRLKDMATNQLQAHLAKLEQEGRVVRQGDRFFLAQRSC